MDPKYKNNAADDYVVRKEIMQITDHIHALKIPFQITDPSGKRIGRFVYVFLIYGKKICLIDNAHPDHIGSAAAIKRISGCTVAAHAAEKAWIEDILLQAKERPVPGFFNLVGGSVQVDCILKEGEPFSGLG